MFRLVAGYLILVYVLVLLGCTSTPSKPDSSKNEEEKAFEEESLREHQSAADVLQNIYDGIGDADSALKELELNDVESMDAESRLIYAILLYNQNRLDDARSELESLLKVDSTMADGWFYLSLIEDLSGSEEARDRALNQAIEADENMVKALTFRGDIAVARSDWKNAEIDYNRALVLDPEEVRSLAGLAWVYAKNDKMDKALSLLDEAIRIEPTYTYAWVDRSRVNLSLGNYGKAEKDLEEAIAQEPNVPWHYLDRAKIRLRYFKNYEGALSDLENVEHRDPDNFVAMVYLAGLHDEQRRFAKAESYYSKVLTMRPDYIWAFAAMGKLSWMRGEYDEAAHWFGKSAAEDTEEFSFQLMKAMSLLKAQKIKESQAEFSKTLRMVEQDGSVYDVVRFCNERNSDFFAVNSLNKETNEGLRERLWFYMGAIYEIEGNNAGARAVFERISHLKGQMEYDMAWATINGMGE